MTNRQGAFGFAATDCHALLSVADGTGRPNGTECVTLLIVLNQVRAINVFDSEHHFL